MYNDHFRWKVGGDGDNGEILIEEMSIVLEIRDALLKEKYPNAFKMIENESGESQLEKVLKVLESKNT